MVLKYSIFRIHTNFKTIKNLRGRIEKKPPNFLIYLFGVTPPVRCYPLLRYGRQMATEVTEDRFGPVFILQDFESSASQKLDICKLSYSVLVYRIF
jgi:hypothetical protein